MNFQDLCFPKYLILVLTYAFLVLLSIAVIHVVFAAANMVVSSIKTCYSISCHDKRNWEKGSDWTIMMPDTPGYTI